MTNGKKAGVMLLACLGGFLAVSFYYGGWGQKKEAPKQEQVDPRVIKIERVVGRVVGGPQIVTGSPLIGFAVYIEKSKSYGALYAKQCPPDMEGRRIVMFQKDRPESNWYTFLDYDQQ